MLLLDPCSRPSAGSLVRFLKSLKGSVDSPTRETGVTSKFSSELDTANRCVFFCYSFLYTLLTRKRITTVCAILFFSELEKLRAANSALEEEKSSLEHRLEDAIKAADFYRLAAANNQVIN